MMKRGRIGGVGKKEVDNEGILQGVWRSCIMISNPLRQAAVQVVVKWRGQEGQEEEAVTFQEGLGRLRLLLSMMSCDAWRLGDR